MKATSLSGERMPAVENVRFSPPNIAKISFQKNGQVVNIGESINDSFLQNGSKIRQIISVGFFDFCGPFKVDEHIARRHHN